MNTTPVSGVPLLDPAALHKAIADVLAHHSMQHTHSNEDDRMPLVDMLTPRGDTDIARGKEELELLADDIYNAVEPLMWRALNPGVRVLAHEEPLPAGTDAGV